MSNKRVQGLRLFNTPLESSIRSLVLLVEAHPAALDLQRLVLFDYALVHSGDLKGGPPSIHPPTPHRSGEVLVRREVVRSGLALLVDRGVADVAYLPEGLAYRATEWASGVLDSLREPYTRALVDRAAWVSATLGALDDANLRLCFSSQMDRWGSEFEATEDRREEPL